MATGKSTDESTMHSELRSISWWASIALGLLIGPTLTWIRTQRYFFFAGAAILAVVIIVIGIYTIRRRTRHPQLAHAKTSWTYAFWTLLLIVLAGPVQLVYLATDLTNLTIKSLLLAIGFTVGIHEVDKAMVKATEKQTSTNS